MSPQLRNLLACTVAVFALFAVGWSLRGQLLHGLANAWIVQDPVSKADAIVVLGGGMQTRPFTRVKAH